MIFGGSVPDANDEFFVRERVGTTYDRDIQHTCGLHFLMATGGLVIGPVIIPASSVIYYLQFSCYEW